MRFLVLLICIAALFISRAAAKDQPISALHIVANTGQVRDQYSRPRNDIQFALRESGLNIFIGTGAIHYQFIKENYPSKTFSTYRIDMMLVGANKHAKVLAPAEDNYTESYYQGATQVTAKSYKKITYKNVYPDIDWVIYNRNNKLEYEFDVHKGGDIADIRLRYDGATTLGANPEGALVATCPQGAITEAAPLSFQADGKEIPTSFVVQGNEADFSVATHLSALTIDPVVKWETYYGNNYETATGVATDRLGNVYMAGNTNSTDNIATVGSFQDIMGGGFADDYLVKFDSAGNRLWATYYGGSGWELAAAAVTCDSKNNIYLLGTTSGSDGLATPGAHQFSPEGQNAFLVKFNSSGARLWATYYGGNSAENGLSVACDKQDNVYITGTTTSTNNIATPGSFKEFLTDTLNGDAFLAKFDSLGALQWGTYYGCDTALDNSWAVTTDSAGNVYIAGETAGATGISTPGAYQAAYGGGPYDGFLVKFNSAGQRQWGTYYGGAGEDHCFGISSVGPSVYIAGYTASLANISTPNSFQPTFGGGYADAYVAKFDTSGNRQWATYYGGTGTDGTFSVDAGNIISCDTAGSLYLAYTTSSTSNISSPEAFQKSYGGGQADAFLVKFNGTGDRVWATYDGSCDDDEAVACAADRSGNIYMAGKTFSTDGMATPAAFQTSLSGVANAFLAKYSNDPLCIQGDTAVCVGDTSVYSIVPIPGATGYTWLLPTGWSGNSQADSIIVTHGNTSGTIDVIANRECSNDTEISLTVTVYPLPQASITQNGDTLSVPGTFSSYQWFLNGNVLPGATNPNYTATQNGAYYVVITNQHGCSNNSDTMNLQNVGVDNLLADSNLCLSPDPNNGIFTVKGTVHDNSCQIIITDITGRVRYKTEANIANFNLDKTVNMGPGFKPGEYFLQIISASGSAVLPFVKE